ncbi:hypothetical protein WME98_32010 [Sorangium sp. So ce296]|uniref:hypothetical protein n=1 Tax=Sorangium sp. So ce296 TaxID=3133296 RepID=UPI003F5E9207
MQVLRELPGLGDEAHVERLVRLDEAVLERLREPRVVAERLREGARALAVLRVELLDARQLRVGGLGDVVVEQELERRLELIDDEPGALALHSGRVLSAELGPGTLLRCTGDSTRPERS